MSSTSVPWPVAHLTGSAADFHQRDLPDPLVAELWWFDVQGPTVVLGSTQPDAVVDQSAAERGGVEVVRRRSGGGAVWLAPGAATWVDVLLPSSDHRWSVDVGRSAVWLGSIWAEVLAVAGVGDARVHEGPMVRGPRDGLVCFAGLAAGEVSVDGRKVVGIAQRRTRSGARLQCAVLHAWDADPLLAVLALTPQERAALGDEVADAAVGIGAMSSRYLVEGLQTRLRASS